MQRFLEPGKNSNLAQKKVQLSLLIPNQLVDADFVPQGNFLFITIGEKLIKFK